MDDPGVFQQRRSSEPQPDFAAFVKGVRRLSWCSGVADEVDFYSCEVGRQRVKGAVGRGHDERRGIAADLFAGQEVADGGAVAMPFCNEMLTPSFARRGRRPMSDDVRASSLPMKVSGVTIVTL
jgi:hypothetical protein